MNIDRRNTQKKQRSLLTDEEWATRHLYEESWAENYWKSRDHPHRIFLAEKICRFSPQSVLEIGCASGPNLYQIAKRFPDAKIRGIDINPMAVQKGNEWFQEEGIYNVKLEVGKAQELSRFADKCFDVVFTDAVLIYIPPEEIKNVAKEMLRISRVIVLNEWYTFNKWLAFVLNIYCYFRMIAEKNLLQSCRFKGVNCTIRPRSPAMGLFVGHWVRDYRALFGEFVPEEKIHITKLPEKLWDDKGWQRWGAIAEVVT